MKILAMLLALSGWAWAQVGFSSSGALQFPVWVLNGSPQELSASHAPMYWIQWENQAAGFQVVFSASQPATAGGRLLPPLTFAAKDGSLIPVSGLTPSGTFETQNQGVLSGLTVLSVPPGALNGSYRYLPLAAGFQLQVPAEAYAGSYSAQIMATLSSGL